MVIVDRVVHEPAGAARTHEAHPAKQTQLMRDGGLADADERRDIAHAQFAGRERVEDSDARRIAEHAERVRQTFDRACRQKALAPCRRTARIEMIGVAAVEVFGGGHSAGSLEGG